LDGILKFMENKISSVKIAIAWLLLSTVVESAPLNNVSETVANTNDSDAAAIGSLSPLRQEPLILMDSVVIADRQDIYAGISGSAKLGIFRYELAPGSLASELAQAQAQSAGSSNDMELRLVAVPGNSYFVSDGSFTVTFRHSADVQQFTSDYDLNPRFESPKAISYFSRGFVGLDELISNIRADERVLTLELDLINPHIRQQ